MGGTREGGLKSKRKLTKGDPNYYSNLAKKARKPRGGPATPGSFANDPARAAEAGAKGGKASGVARRNRKAPARGRKSKSALPTNAGKTKEGEG